MKEIWEDIKGWEGKYQVSNLGRVKSLPRTTIRNGHIANVYGRILKQRINQDGYYSVSLGNSPRVPYRVHRLVAEAFIDNKHGLAQVNHIDGNKTNNLVSNLEWVSQLDNFIHCRDVLKKTFGSKKIKCVETGEIYQSIKKAARSKKLFDSNIIKAADHKNGVRTCGGYHWQRI